MSVLFSVRARGAALVETALVTSTILLIMLGTLKIGVIGYTQMSLDGAAFIFAHQIALKKPTGTAAGAATAVFKAVDPAGLTATTKTADDVTVVPDGDQNNRHGGQSAIRPMRALATVQKTIDGIPGGPPATLRGMATEPFNNSVSIHQGISGINPNDPTGQVGAGAVGNVDDPLGGDSSSPPFFVGFHFIDGCAVNPVDKPWSDCSFEGVGNHLALGVAEFLDIHNWGRRIIGVTGTPSDTVFAETACHQRRFAAIAGAVANSPTITSTLQAQLSKTNADVATVYSWDATLPGGYPPAGPPDDNGPAGLHPERGC